MVRRKLRWQIRMKRDAQREYPSTASNIAEDACQPSALTTSLEQESPGMTSNTGQDTAQQLDETMTLEQPNDWLISNLGAPPSECAENVSQEQEGASQVLHHGDSLIGVETVPGASEAPALATTVTPNGSNAPPLAHASDSNLPPVRNKKTRRQINNHVKRLRVAKEQLKEIQKSKTDLEAFAARQGSQICKLQQELQECKEKYTMLQNYISIQESRIRDLVGNLGMVTEDKAFLKVALEAATARTNSLTQNLGSMTSDNAQPKESMRVQSEYIAWAERVAREKEASEVTTTKDAEERIAQPTSMTDSQLRAEFPALFSTRMMTYDPDCYQRLSDEEEKTLVDAYNSVIAIRDEIIYGMKR